MATEEQRRFQRAIPFTMQKTRVKTHRRNGRRIDGYVRG